MRIIFHDFNLSRQINLGKREKGREGEEEREREREREREIAFKKDISAL